MAEALPAQHNDAEDVANDSKEEHESSAIQVYVFGYLHFDVFGLKLIISGVDSFGGNFAAWFITAKLYQIQISFSCKA